jgi:hypothetical protein
VWNHFGDRWSFSYIDVAKCFDESLSFQRKNYDRSTRNLQLTAVQVVSRKNHLVVGDNRGTVRIFQLSVEDAGT